MTPTERLAAMPPEAAAIIHGLAKDHGIADPILIMGDYPHEAAVVAARRDAFALLSSKAGFGSWSINDIAGWFGITRKALWAARCKSARVGGWVSTK